MKWLSYFLFFSLAINQEAELFAQGLFVQGTIPTENGSTLTFSESPATDGFFSLLLLNENGIPKKEALYFEKNPGGKEQFAKISLDKGDLQNIRIRIEASGFDPIVFNLKVHSRALFQVDETKFILDLSILFGDRTLSAFKENLALPNTSIQPPKNSKKPIFPKVWINVKVHNQSQPELGIPGAEVSLLGKTYQADNKGDCLISLELDSIRTLKSDPQITAIKEGYDRTQVNSGLLSLANSAFKNKSITEVLIIDVPLRSKGFAQVTFVVKERKNERPIELVFIRVIEQDEPSLQLNTVTDFEGKGVLNVAEHFIRKNKGWLSFEIQAIGIDTIRKWVEIREFELIGGGKVIKTELIYLDRPVNKEIKTIRISGLVTTKWSPHRPVSDVKLHLQSSKLELEASSLSDNSGAFSFYLIDSLILANEYEFFVLPEKPGYKITHFDKIKVNQDLLNSIRYSGKFFLGNFKMKMDQPPLFTLALPGLNPILRKRLYKSDWSQIQEKQSVKGWALFGGFILGSGSTLYCINQSQNALHEHKNTSSQIEADMYYQQYLTWQKRSIAGLGVIGLTYVIQTLDYFIWKNGYKHDLESGSPKLNFGGISSISNGINLGSFHGHSSAQISLGWDF